ncbi:MAG: hypothetical protein OCC49_01775 [Fibrobacterales bacterium]
MRFISVVSMFYLLLFVVTFSQGCGGASVESEDLSSSSVVEVKPVTVEEVDYLEGLLNKIRLQLQDTYVDTTTRFQTYYLLTQAVGSLEDFNERLVFELDTAENDLYRDTLELRVLKVDSLHEFYFPMMP